MSVPSLQFREMIEGKRKKKKKKKRIFILLNTGQLDIF